MAKVFTKSGATNLQAKFRKMCEQFAEENGVELSRNHLTYGEDLIFKTTFTLAENKNEAWDNMVSWFWSTHNVRLSVGETFRNGNKSYTINGKLNPANSKYKIGATENRLGGKDTYFTIDGIIQMLGRK